MTLTTILLAIILLLAVLLAVLVRSHVRALAQIPAHTRAVAETVAAAFRERQVIVHVHPQPTQEDVLAELRRQTHEAALKHAAEHGATVDLYTDPANPVMAAITVTPADAPAPAADAASLARLAGFEESNRIAAAVHGTPDATPPTQAPDAAPAAGEMGVVG